MSIPQTIDLTENAMRVLWPPDPDLQLDNSTSMSNAQIRPSRMRPLSQTRDIEFTLQDGTIGPFSSRYLRCKFKLGNKVRVRIPVNSETGRIQEYIIGDLGKRAVSASLRAVINEKLTIALTAELSERNFEDVFVKIGQGDWGGAAATVANLSFRFNQIPPLFDLVDRIDFGISADDNFCFFYVTGLHRFEIPIRSIGSLSRMLPSGFPRNATLHLDTTASLRFGLTPLAWYRCGVRLGGRAAIRAAIRTISSAAARAAVSAAVVEAAIPMVIVAAGAGYFYGMVYLVNQAHTTGANTGHLSHYCTGYLRRIKFAHDNRMPHQRFSPLMRYGWDDAGKAIRATSLERVEQTIITHFGSTYEQSPLAIAGETAEVVVGFFTGNDRDYIHMNTMETIHSAVGDTIDTEHEITVVGSLRMAPYLARNIDKVAEYLAGSQSGVAIRSLEH